MAGKVIIVESPNKAKTIRQLVGRDFEVLATVGHFCDLPLKELGVDVENGFKPTYVYDGDKKDVIAKLKALKGRYAPGDILVASDADREGEAIGWHIARTIGLKPAEVRRAEFHEITGPGIQRALGAVRPLDLGLVAAQEARRILDRLVGYTVSPVVRDRLPDERDISAGRVQSVALRVVVDRENAIRAFVPTEYWSVTARYPWPSIPPQPNARKHWEAEFAGRVVPKRGGGVGFEALPLPDEAAASAIASALSAAPHRVVAVARKQSQRRPPAPFITSTMLQKAHSRLKMSTDETTRHAKTLFERGLVTYIRTDEPSVSPEFQRETLSYLKERFGSAVVPAKPNVYKAKGAANSQGAHECIRPTQLANESPGGLEPRASALYALIRETYLASQCASARYDVTEAALQVGEYGLKAIGRVLVEPGFLAIFGESAEDEEGENPDAKPLPPLKVDESHRPTAVAPKQHWTKPPERFSEASLIKYLEANGIGRPSTYNAMVAKILQKGFVATVQKRFLQPTPKGEKLDGELRRFFAPVINEGFTAELETHLDAIADRREDWRAYLAGFWGELTPLVATAREGTPARGYGGARSGGRAATGRGKGRGASAEAGEGGNAGGAVFDANAPMCPQCKESFTKRIRSAKMGQEYYVCSRDSQEKQVCGFIMGVKDVINPPCPACKAPSREIAPGYFVCVLSRKDGSGCPGRYEAPQDLSGNPSCHRCNAPMKRVASKNAFRCSVDACNTWLDADYALNPPCPMCQGPTRAVPGKGYGCAKWRKEGGEGSCSGWVSLADWSPPAAAPGAPAKPKGARPADAPPKRATGRARATSPKAPKAPSSKPSAQKPASARKKPPTKGA